jgi:hypothetical protein
MDIKRVDNRLLQRRNTLQSLGGASSLVGKSFDFVTLQSNVDKTTNGDLSDQSDNEYENFKDN